MLCLLVVIVDIVVIAVVVIAIVIVIADPLFNNCHHISPFLVSSVVRYVSCNYFIVPFWSIDQQSIYPWQASCWLLILLMMIYIPLFLVIINNNKRVIFWCLLSSCCSRLYCGTSAKICWWTAYSSSFILLFLLNFFLLYVRYNILYVPGTCTCTVIVPVCTGFNREWLYM